MSNDLGNQFEQLIHAHGTIGFAHLESHRRCAVCPDTRALGEVDDCRVFRPSDCHSGSLASSYTCCNYHPVSLSSSQLDVRGLADEEERGVESRTER